MGILEAEAMSLTRAKYFLFGFVLGLLVPAIIFLVELIGGINPIIAGKRNILYLIGIALDMMALRIALRWQNDVIIKGMALSMFISALFIFNYRFPG